MVATTHLTECNTDIKALSADVYIAGKRIPMTPKECDLLFLLARYNGKAFSRQELLDKIT